MKRRTTLKALAMTAPLAGCTTTPESTTSDTDVEFHHAGVSTTGGTDYSATLPHLQFQDAVSIDGATSFTVENLDTGDATTITPSEEPTETAAAVTLAMYDADGTLTPEDADIVANASEGGRNRLPSSLDGDDTTFTKRERASYRATMRQDGTEVGTTEFEMTVGHPRDFQYTTTDTTVEVSINAGTIPTDGEINAYVYLDDGSQESNDAGYDSDVDRFVARFDRSAIPAGEHQARFHIKNSETDRMDMALGGRITIQ
jgi:hypothetical protein